MIVFEFWLVDAGKENTQRGLWTVNFNLSDDTVGVIIDGPTALGFVFRYLKRTRKQIREEYFPLKPGEVQDFSLPHGGKVHITAGLTNHDILYVGNNKSEEKKHVGIVRPS